jgi:hypothetical protein
VFLKTIGLLSKFSTSNFIISAVEFSVFKSISDYSNLALEGVTETYLDSVLNLNVREVSLNFKYDLAGEAGLNFPVVF